MISWIPDVVKGCLQFFWELRRFSRPKKGILMSKRRRRGGSRTRFQSSGRRGVNVMGRVWFTVPSTWPQPNGENPATNQLLIPPGLGGDGGFSQAAIAILQYNPILHVPMTELSSNDNIEGVRLSGRIRVDITPAPSVNPTDQISPVVVGLRIDEWDTGLNNWGLSSLTLGAQMLEEEWTYIETRMLFFKDITANAALRDPSSVFMVPVNHVIKPGRRLTLYVANCTQAAGNGIAIALGGRLRKGPLD